MDAPLFLYETPSEMPAFRPVRLFPVPMEETVSYGQGTARGPAALWQASQQVEYYLPAAGDEPCLALGLETQPALEAASPAGWVDAVEAAARRALADDRLPAFVGGEHTLTQGAVRAALDARPDAVVLQIDAHADLRDAYQGSGLSHACVLRRCLDAGAEIVSAGVRALSAEEAALQRDHPRVHALTVREIRRRPDAAAERVRGRPLYVTVDLDGLDPSVLPGVGTPVPGGLLWQETLDLLAAAVDACDRVLGIDVVELAPAPGDLLSPYAAAQLLYHLAALAARRNLRGPGRG